MKTWKLPAIILGILILAFVFRWDNTASSTSDGVITKYKVDRWNGDTWQETFSNSGHTLKCIDYNRSGHDAENQILLWYILVALDSVWLLLALKGFKKKTKTDVETSKI